MPNTKRCFCEDWESWNTWPNGGIWQYFVIVLNQMEPKFCPWCGSPLAESKGEWEKQNTGIKALVDFVRNQEDAPPEFNKVIDDNFWELLA